MTPLSFITTILTGFTDRSSEAFGACAENSVDVILARGAVLAWTTLTFVDI